MIHFFLNPESACTSYITLQDHNFKEIVEHTCKNKYNGYFSEKQASASSKVMAEAQSSWKLMRKRMVSQPTSSYINSNSP